MSGEFFPLEAAWQYRWEIAEGAEFIRARQWLAQGKTVTHRRGDKLLALRWVEDPPQLWSRVWHTAWGPEKADQILGSDLYATDWLLLENPGEFVREEEGISEAEASPREKAAGDSHSIPHDKVWSPCTDLGERNWICANCGEEGHEIFPTYHYYELRKKFREWDARGADPS